MTFVLDGGIGSSLLALNPDDCVDCGGRRFISRKDSSPVLAALIVWRASTLRAAVGATSEEEPLSSSDERELLRPTAELQPSVKTSRSSWRLGWWRSRSAREVGAQTLDSREQTGGPAESQRPGLLPAASAPESMVSSYFAEKRFDRGWCAGGCPKTEYQSGTRQGLYRACLSS